MTASSGALLRLRTIPPVVSPGFVHRPHLDVALSDAVCRPITLVSAGPGCGKTLTVASWVRREPGRRIAWLTVDETDNDLQTFWSDLLRTLVVNDVIPPDSALRDISPAETFGHRETMAVRSALAQLTDEVVVVLDDFHCVRDPEVLTSIRRLLDPQPPSLRLVIITRMDPSLHLHRARLQGDLAEIRAADLAFDSVDAQRLFQVNDVQVSDEERAELLARTEGWAAGLRMAVMCLAPPATGGSSDRFGGTDRLVAEYLMEELLGQLPEHERRFLVTTSIVDPVNADLANALTGRTDSRPLLEALVARNVLVVALVPGSDWFRVHPMFLELLRYRLTVDHPELVDELRHRAARWFAEHGEPVEAITHAVAARDWPEVGGLLARHAWPYMLTQHRSALAAALEPAEAEARTNPSWGTLLATAIRHFHRHEMSMVIREAEEAARLFEAALLEGPDGTPGAARPGDRDAVHALIGLLRVAHSRGRDPARAIELCQAQFARLEFLSPMRLPTYEQHRAITLNNLAVAQLWAGELDAAERNLHRVIRETGELRLTLTGLSAQGYLALLDALRGRLPTAEGRATSALADAVRRGWTSQPQMMPIYGALALVHLEQERLDAASSDVAHGLAADVKDSEIAGLLALLVCRTAIAAIRGGAGELAAAVAELEATQRRAGAIPPMLSLLCAVARAGADLADGQPEAALARLDPDDSTGPARVGRPTGYARWYAAVARSEAWLRLDRPANALAEVDRFEANTVPYVGPLVAGKVLAAVACLRTNRQTAALAALSEAIEHAAPMGLLRPFVAAGTELSPLIDKHRHVIARHLDFTGGLMARPSAADPAGGPARPAPPIEALTERELTILVYLPTMFKSSEIASDLAITINTVKTHQQSIYRKLGVNSRREAVDRARALRLL